MRASGAGFPVRSHSTYPPHRLYRPSALVRDRHPQRYGCYELLLKTASRNSTKMIFAADFNTKPFPRFVDRNAFTRRNISLDQRNIHWLVMDPFLGLHG